MTRLFVSDLDGTLLDPTAELSPRSRAGVLALLEAGIHFSVATARSHSSIRHILSDVPLRLPVVEFNGAYLTDLATGAHHLMRSIPTARVDEIFACATRRGLVGSFSGTGDDGDVLFFPPPVNDGTAWYRRDRQRRRDPRVREVDDPTQHTTHAHIVCINFIDREERLVDLAAELQERFSETVVVTLFANEYDPGWHWLTVHAAEATKANGVRALVEYAALHDHELIVFGDQRNDLPLFEVADYAVAVGNAVPELQAVADEVIGAHDTDSVIAWLLDATGVSS